MEISSAPNSNKLFPWRTEPDPDLDRQNFLTACLATQPDIKQNIYPFKDVKLTRADIEWLLITHENGRGPVDWSDERQREREGLDLRGADLRDVNLSNLPLARLLGGIARFGGSNESNEQRRPAAVIMEGAKLSKTHLE